MNAAVGGVLAALAWGSADFIARFTGGALGHVRALFGMLVASALALTAVVLVAGYPIGGLDDGWWLLLTSGTGLTLATMLLYQGLVRGPVTVAAPLAGTFPAFNILLALALGVRPTLAEWLAIVCVMAGVFLVARSAADLASIGQYGRSHVRGTVLVALGASFFFAVTVAAGQEAAAVHGEVQSVFLARWVALAVCCLVLMLRREAPRVPLRWWPALAAQGALDGSALVAIVAASQGAGSAVVAVLASTFSAVTVVLARMFLREIMSRAQWIGIVLIIAGVAVLSGARS